MSAMVALSLEYGMATWSLCAELAFRIRVSMSAIGSVMVMGLHALSHRGFPRCRRAAGAGDLRCSRLVEAGRTVVCGALRSGRGSPGGLRHARELAPVRHLPQADPAQAELLVDRVG